MSLWSQQKFDYCTRDEPEKKEEGGSRTKSQTNPSPRVVGISRLTNTTATMPKTIGYKIDKLVVGGEYFVGAVTVATKKAGDSWKKLIETFKSQTDMNAIEGYEEVTEFRDNMKTKYKGKEEKIMKECRLKLLDSPEIKWWKVEDVEKLVSEARERAFSSVPIKKEPLTEPIKESTGESSEKTETSAKAASKTPPVTAPKIVVVKPDSAKKEPPQPTVREDKVITKANAAKYETDKKQKEAEKKKMKDLESKLEDARKVIHKKELKITALQQSIDETEVSLKRETVEMKTAMEKKDEEIKYLNEEVGELENTVKDKEKIIRDITGKIEWVEDIEENERVKALESDLKIKEDKLDEVSKEKKNLGRSLERKENEMKVLCKEKETLEQKLNQIKEQLDEESKKLSEKIKQTKEISDNANALANKLVKQKTDMQKEIDETKLEVEKRKKEVDLIKKELDDRNQEIKDLKKKTGASSTALDAAAIHGKLDNILRLVDHRQSPAASTSTNSSRPQSGGPPSDIQVSRVQTTNTTILTIGNPEILRNFENIQTLKKSVTDLIKSKNLENVTGDYEGFEMKSLENDVNKIMKETTYAGATKQGEGRRLSSVILFPGNHYVAKAVVEGNKAKNEYWKKRRMNSALDSLITDTVSLMSVTEGVVKKIMIVIDPSNNETYDFSVNFQKRMETDLMEWKNNFTGSDQVTVEIFNLTEEQEKSGMRMLDKKGCFEIEKDLETVWLDRKFVTSDGSRVSKLASIKIFNKLVDFSTNTSPPAAACEDCGIQKSTNYGCKCNANDIGDFKSCVICMKDSHDTDSCWSMKCQSENACTKMNLCKKNGWKHNPNVHSVVDPVKQEEVINILGQKIEFWPKSRMKRPFFFPSQDRDGPPTKRPRTTPT